MAECTDVLFMKIFEEKLDQKIAFLEKTSKENQALILATRKNLAARCDKMKEAKREIIASKKHNEELKKNLADLRESKSELSDYIELLKSDAKRFRKEVEDADKDQNQRLEDLEKKWKIYQAQYETLPLAVVRREEETRLMKSKIELLMKQQKVAEMKKIIQMRDEIDDKLRNSLVVECVKLCNEIKVEEIENRAVLSDRAKLEEELRQQCATISELKKKRAERIAQQQQQKALEKSLGKIPTPSSSNTSSQNRPRYQLPQFHVSDSVYSVYSPSLVLQKDSDSISITSSVIDSLIERPEHQIEATNETDQVTETVRAPEEVQTANPEEEEEEDQECRGRRPANQKQSTDHPSSNLRSIENPITTNGSEKSFDMSEMVESDALDEVQGYGSPNQNRARQLPNAAANRDYHTPTDGERSHLVNNEPIREGQRGLLGLGEPAPKIPRISKIEKVQMNMEISEQNIDDDPLKHYFARSESNASSNWIPSRHLSSVFSNTAADYHRSIIDTEVQSSHGSETSMQIEDMMKEFRAQFSPDQRRGSRREEYRINLREADHRTERQPEPQAGPSAPSSQTNVPKSAVPFLSGFGKPSAITDAKGPKKDQFFLSMF